MPPPQHRWRRALSGLLIVALLTHAFLTLAGNVIVQSWRHDPSCMWTRICMTVFFCGMSAWCFVTVVSRPSFYVHDALVNPISVTVKRSNGGPRWCSKCAAPKPDRCHHCRQCHRCITRMDHHCPWPWKHASANGTTKHLCCSSCIRHSYVSFPWKQLCGHVYGIGL